MDDTVYENYDISMEKWIQFCQSRRGYEYLENKLMEEKKKKELEEAAQSRSTDTIIDP